MVATHPKVFIADLSHTATGIAAQTFPLGASYVLAYARQELGDRFDFDLFRFPDEMTKAILQDQPTVLAFSNYAWNFELGYKIASWAKEKYPETITVFGGPNFPISNDEQVEFFKDRPSIDFYIQNEGELGFVDLLNKLETLEFSLAEFQKTEIPAINTSYLTGDKVVQGQFGRILDLDRVPSPYTTGILDEYFNHPLLPMIETTRGCPFSCSYCADGLKSKNKVVRFSQNRINADLDYVANHVQNVDHLVITDLNFGMYKQDLDTAKYIAGIQAEKSWPIAVDGATGKNQPERVIEALSTMNGTWSLGSSVQSTDKEVLENINRSNISLDAYNKRGCPR